MSKIKEIKGGKNITSAIPREDKTFWIAIILTAGVFATMLGGGLGFVYGNEGWTNYWREMMAILLGPTAIYWVLYQKEKVNLELKELKTMFSEVARALKEKSDKDV